LKKIFKDTFRFSQPGAAVPTVSQFQLSLHVYPEPIIVESNKKSGRRFLPVSGARRLLPNHFSSLTVDFSAHYWYRESKDEDSEYGM
jgi:hypothetical protein